MRKYCDYYCGLDVKILKEAYIKFRELLLKEFNLDCVNFLSISSIAI